MKTKLQLCTAGFLAAGSMAMAQTPAPAPGNDGSAPRPLPVCSTEDAAKVRQGATPSMPCRILPENGQQGSTPSTPTPSAPR